MESSVNGPVQLREVYSLVQSVRAEILAELKTLDARWDSRMTAHEGEHDRDQMRKSSLVRWAVTSILTGIGVLISLWLAMR